MFELLGSVYEWDIEVISQYYGLINFMLLITAVIILISSLDDFLIDIIFWVRTAYRKLFAKEKHSPVAVQTLMNNPEKPAAIMVPAWQEFDVITQMIETNMSFVKYDNYVFFVGVYQNDHKTQAEVDKLASKYPTVKKVVVPHDGPTCKADCLNWIIKAIFLYENQINKKFEMIIMHDSEDVIHPLELKMFNHFVSNNDLIQIPVRGLTSKWNDFVRGSYVDEFSEFHSKEIPVRGMLTKIVPSAGVSTCFSRKAILILAEDNEQQVFNTSSLTEDYDISHRLHRANKLLTNGSRKSARQSFMVLPVSTSFTQHIHDSYESKQTEKKVPIACSEYFPSRLWLAVRQKTRWNIGIFFQAMSLTHWRSGNAWAKYFFIHERKGIITNLIMLPGYFLAFNILCFRFFENYLGFPEYVFDLPQWLLFANLALMINRAVQRCYFTTTLYNWREGILSIPRIIVSNVINFCATFRATWIYTEHLITKKRIAWDKTTHEFPSTEVSQANYERLGSLLVEKGVISQSCLQEVLEEQKESTKALDQILLEKGFVNVNDLLDVLAIQASHAKRDQHLAMQAKHAKSDSHMGNAA